MQVTRISLMMLAVGSLLLPGQIATAQQPSAEGVVQLGHRAQARRAARRATNQCAPAMSCLPANPCMNGGSACGCGTSCGCGNGCSCGNGICKGACGGCHSGNCPHSQWMDIHNGIYGYGCDPGCHQCCLSELLNKMSPYHTCTFPPDYGWAKPAQRPMWPTSASYRRQFPAAWTGEEQGIDPSFRHPTIYMPTDTTQLGYYYQHTPYWKARENMIPPVPHPAEWHTPDLGVVFTGWEDGQCYSAQGFPAGTIIDQGGSVCPTPAATPGDNTPTPVPAAPAPSTETGMGKSATVPQLVPVPRR